MSFFDGSKIAFYKQKLAGQTVKNVSVAVSGTMQK